MKPNDKILISVKRKNRSIIKIDNQANASYLTVSNALQNKKTLDANIQGKNYCDRKFFFPFLRVYLSN